MPPLPIVQLPGVRRAILALGVATAGLLARPTVAHAQHGAIAGRVTDSASHAPIADAQVRVAGTSLATTTRTDGTYRLADLPAGPATVRVLRLGFRAGTRAVTIADSGTVTVDVVLAPAATTLDQVVVQATGETERTRETGNAVQTLSPDSVPLAATAQFSDLLSSRVPGLQVTQQSGTTGGSSRILIRGNNSVSLANQPLIVVDGIRVDNDDGSTQLDVGGQVPSRFDDLDASEIESIDVLKGPAASALYGTAGANGVLQITTRRGVSGRTTWRTWAEYGSVRNFTAYPANYAQIGLDPSGNTITQCTLLLQFTGGCTAFPDSLVSFNPLATYSPNIPGWRTAFGLSANGGNDALNYFINADHRDEHGVYPNNYDRQTNARTNFHAALSPTIDVSANIGYLQSSLGLPQNDNASYGVLSGGLLGQAFNDPVQHGYVAGVTPDILAQVLSTQNVDRLTGGFTATWRPRSWMSVVAVTGLDYTNELERQIVPAEVLPIFPTGYVQTDILPHYLYTTNLTATAHYGIARDLQGSTSIGTQYNDESGAGTVTTGQGVAPGTGTLTGATNTITAVEQNSQIVTFGLLGQEQIAWRDRLFLTAALRGDENSAFGLVHQFVLYPDASLSWVIGEEPWFPHTSVLSSLRLRTAYGESGQRPDFRQALTYFTPVPAKKNGNELLGVIDTTTGNGDLKPEISREIEGGFDAGFFHDRISLTVTYYNKNTHDALVQRTLAPSSGGNTQFVNLGEVSNKGFEASISGTILDLRSIQADVTINESVNHNKLVKLGQGISPITFDAGDAADTQEDAAGYPLGGYWSYPYSYADANHDGIIDPSEITVGSNLVYMGSPFASDETSIAPSVTLFHVLRLSALFDRRAGVVTYNGTEEFRCGFSNTICRGAYDPTASLKSQAAAITESLGLSDAGAYEDGSFWKWRELTAAVTLPDRWAHRVGARKATVSVSGRNLATWTKYTGFDPEINFAPNNHLPGGESPLATSDFLTQPPVRYWTGRVDLQF